MARRGSQKVIYAALAGNLAVALTKLAAALWTGSSAMLSESIHSAVDTGNQGLLLFGLHRSARPPDAEHPFGHGMELYFWAFVVALLIFTLGGTFSIYDGYRTLTRPEPLENLWVNFVVLAAAMVFESLSLRVAWREFRTVHADQPFLAAIRRSKNPSVFAVLIEDGAAVIGLLIAACGLGLTAWLGNPIFDGIASIAIGGLLVLAAVFLANETRSLLTGETASRQVLATVRGILDRDGRVAAVDELLTMHLGPDEILLAITLEFRTDLTGGAVHDAAGELTRAIREALPSITRVFLGPRPSPRS